MSYDQFLEEVKTAVQGELGIGYDVRTQKNNEEQWSCAGWVDNR